MPFFTGRFDMLFDEDTMMDIFQLFIEKFNESDEDGDTLFGFTFEDKTKTGLPTKPHYHFYMMSNYKHDTIRKYMTEVGFPKHTASIKESDVLDLKWQYYIFKQGEVVYTDMDESTQADCIEAALKYQQSIEPTLNTFKDHMEHYLSTLDRSKTYIPVYDWINTSNKFQPHFYETPSGILAIDDLLKYYIAAHIGEFQLPCRQTFTHWLVVFTKELAKDDLVNVIDAFYKNTIF